ncbi:uncharacterized protein BKA55DRAFT_252487 [Fusarium redolens]|uniref:Uncharacterized protein n=1 Tax=Fusarium redolens TaxID=48865 RepID=A0A9P9HXT7_FUSRE|nr:uncharacterized protein BKA55DRAFT_252487 [Fusarium redolens]KAH7265505.1 hypothetical protein BKA55DRAFT_252487 [Fusarium redolens]
MFPLRLGISFRDGWIFSRVAPNLDRRFDRRGSYHLDEIVALCNYLNKTMSAESAARAITADCLDRYSEGDTAGALMRRNNLWRLLASTLLRFEDDCDMIVDLLVAIQSLPTMDSRPWWVTDPRPSESLCELPEFHRCWQFCYERNRCKCHDKFHDHRDTDDDFPHDRKYYKRAGTAEAKMYLRGIPGITEFWAYKTINLVCLWNHDLEFFIYEIHAWLQTAGPKLAEALDSNQIKCFERGVRGRPDKKYDISVTMFEHWHHWKKSFLEVSFDEDFLSRDARELARECHDIMKVQNIKLPLFL